MANAFLYTLLFIAVVWTVTYYKFSFNSMNDPATDCWAFQVFENGPWTSSPIPFSGVNDPVFASPISMNDQVFASRAIQDYFAWGFISYSIKFESY